MFTGIIQAIGRIQTLQKRCAAARMSVDSGALDLSDVKLGDSIAVSGACLTVTDFAPGRFAVDVSPETLACTALGALAIGSPVNLEKALRLSDRLGGHLVSGHVDGVGTVVARETRAEFVFFRVRPPPALTRYIATKGSICVDGVSLTVNAAAGDEFELLIIPHTLTETTLNALHVGSTVNLEVDLIARYLEQLALQFAAPTPGLTHDILRGAGFGSN